MYDEVEDVLKSHNISEFRAKEVARKYAFEIKDVPAESTKWQKVVYGFDRTLPARFCLCIVDAEG